MTYMFDVVFIHAPSVYDFRKLKRVHYGPISDVVPSTPVFDMYPYGFFSLATYLELNGFKTGIFNIAARMVNNPRLDVVKLLKNIKANVYAIDIHWLVHAHGSIEIAKLIKDMHRKPVIVGG
ncbi:MAG: TIGR04190 family B12-binding domain/radical SAM domain protein, partial [Thermoprotei archaeon]